jgi:hypothetical protein
MFVILMVLDPNSFKVKTINIAKFKLKVQLHNANMKSWDIVVNDFYDILIILGSNQCCTSIQVIPWYVRLGKVWICHTCMTWYDPTHIFRIYPYHSK